MLAANILKRPQFHDAHHKGIYLILSQEYSGLEESLKRLNILSFDRSVFLNKAKIMYKVHNNIAPSYLQELFHMRDINLNNTVSSLRSVAQHNYIVL